MGKSDRPKPSHNRQNFRSKKNSLCLQRVSVQNGYRVPTKAGPQQVRLFFGKQKVGSASSHRHGEPHGLVFGGGKGWSTILNKGHTCAGLKCVITISVFRFDPTDFLNLMLFVHAKFIPTGFPSSNLPFLKPCNF